MKIILAIMCSLVALFSGGCAIVLMGIGSGQGGMPGLGGLAILLFGVALLNLLLLGGLFGWGFRWRTAFYILGAIDLLVAAAGLLPSIIPWTGIAPSDASFFSPFALVIALKGALSIIYGNRLGNELAKPVIPPSSNS